MKVELKSGEIVTIEKDCECITHNGPHWVHMDRTWKKMNQEMPATSPLTLHARAEAEVRRLDEKGRMMKSLGIVRLIAEPCDELSNLQKERLARHYAEIAKRAEARCPTPKADREKRYVDWQERNEVRQKARHSF